jgi:hypothetical protein
MPLSSSRYLVLGTLSLRFISSLYMIVPTDMFDRPFVCWTCNFAMKRRGNMCCFSLKIVDVGICISTISQILALPHSFTNSHQLPPFHNYLYVQPHLAEVLPGFTHFKKLKVICYVGSGFKVHVACKTMLFAPQQFFHA